MCKTKKNDIFISQKYCFNFLNVCCCGVQDKNYLVKCLAKKRQLTQLTKIKVKNFVQKFCTDKSLFVDHVLLFPLFIQGGGVVQKDILVVKNFRTEGW